MGFCSAVHIQDYLLLLDGGHSPHSHWQILNIEVLQNLLKIHVFIHSINRFTILVPLKSISLVSSSDPTTRLLYMYKFFKYVIFVVFADNLLSMKFSSLKFINWLLTQQNKNVSLGMEWKVWLEQSLFAANSTGLYDQRTSPYGSVSILITR